VQEKATRISEQIYQILQNGFKMIIQKNKQKKTQYTENILTINFDVIASNYSL